MNTAALEASNLTVNRDGRRILDVPSFRVAGGEVLAVIGPNGSGKTTLLQCLALLLKPDSGLISYRGHPVSGKREALAQRRRIAVVFQEPNLLRGTVHHNVSLGMRLRGFQEDEITARARRWLERFGISGLAGRQVATLSGGEAQRVSLARAFSMEPEVIFLDEPFAALDAPTRQSLLFEMGAVLKETGATAVLVTHDRDEALALGDRAAVLIQGGIAQTGRPGEIFSSPADEAVAAFVGVENVLSGDISRQRDGIATVTLSDGITIEAVSGLPAGTPVSACLRPEDITLSLAGNPTASSARNRVVGKVSGLLPAGAQTRVRISGAINLNAQITTRSCQEMDLKQETPVAASFKATSVHLIPRI